jgi:hypothetical protein
MRVLSAATRFGLTLPIIFFCLSRAAMAQERFRLVTSLSAAEVYDDNLFFSPAAPESDRIWRLSPRVGFDRRGPRLTLQAAYGLDAESYRRHRSLDTPLAAQQASFEMRWSLSPRLAASTTAAYVESQSPGMLNTLVGLQVGRHRGRSLSARETLTLRLGERTEAILEPSLASEAVEGLPRNDMQAAALRVERRLSGLDRGRVTYSARRFAFDGRAVMAHVVTLGWSHEITPRAHFEIEGGPRVTEGMVGAEVTASLRHHFARGEAVLSYLHTQTTVLGAAGPVMTKGVSAEFSQRLSRSLTLAAGPTFARVEGRGTEFEVYRLNTDVTWRLTSRLSLSASHQFNFQSGVPAPTAPLTEIIHNGFALRAVATASGR